MHQNFNLTNELVQCNMCEWVGQEDELIIEMETPEESERNFFKACPNCKTDDYLMDK
jgi:hypothetical protein